MIETLLCCPLYEAVYVLSVIPAKAGIQPNMRPKDTLLVLGAAHDV
jgi:hypothetical protein